MQQNQTATTLAQLCSPVQALIQFADAVHTSTPWALADHPNTVTFIPINV